MCTVVVVLFIFQARTNAYITWPTQEHLSYTKWQALIEAAKVSMHCKFP